MATATTRPSARSTPIAGAALQRLRVNKGWDVAELAARAGCTKDTVTRAEAGSRVFLATAKALADALGVKPDSLLTKTNDGAAEQDKTPNGQGAALVDLHIKYCDMEVKLSIPFDQFDQCDQLVALVNMIGLAIQSKYGIGVKAVRKGSTIITLEMAEDDARRLVIAFKSGRLKPLDVVNVRYSGRWRIPRWTTANLALAAASLLFSLTGVIPLNALPYYWAGLALAFVSGFLAFRSKTGYWLAIIGLVANTAAIIAWPHTIGFYKTEEGYKLKSGNRHRVIQALPPEGHIVLQFSKPLTNGDRIKVFLNGVQTVDETMLNGIIHLPSLSKVPIGTYHVQVFHREKLVYSDRVVVKDGRIELTPIIIFND